MPHTSPKPEGSEPEGLQHEEHHIDKTTSDADITPSSGMTRRRMLGLLGGALAATATMSPKELIAAPRKYDHLPEQYEQGIWMNQQPDAKNQMTPEVLNELVANINEAFARIDKAVRIKHRSGKSLPDFFPANRRDHDVRRILALITKESGGDNSLESSSQARGLCQVRDVVVDDVREHFPKLTRSYDLHNPVDNILVALIYFQILESHYIDSAFGAENPDKEKLLFACYNGGITRLRAISEHYGTKDWQIIARKLSSAIVEKQAKDGYGEDREWRPPMETLDPTYGVTFIQYDTGIQHAEHAEDELLKAGEQTVSIRKAQEFIRYAELIPAIEDSIRFGAPPRRSLERSEKADSIYASPMQNEGIWDLHRRYRIDVDFPSWLEEFKRINNLESNVINTHTRYEIPGLKAIIVQTTLYAALQAAGIDPNLYPVVWEYNVACNKEETAGRDMNHLVSKKIAIPPQLSGAVPNMPKAYDVGPEGTFTSLWALLTQLKPKAVPITSHMLEQVVSYNKAKNNEDFQNASVHGLAVRGLQDEFQVMIPETLFGTKEEDVPPSPEKIPYEYEIFTLTSKLPNPFRVSLSLFDHRKTNMLSNIDYFQDEDESEYTRRKYLRLILLRFNQQYYSQVFEGKEYNERALKKMLIPTDAQFYNKILEGEDDAIDDAMIDQVSREGVSAPATTPTPIAPEDLRPGSHYIEGNMDTIGDSYITNSEGFDVSHCRKNEKFDKLSQRRKNRDKTTHIILHSTGGNTPEGTLVGGKAHYVVTKEGEIIQVRDVNDSINHAGVGRKSSKGACWRGDTNISYHSVGIEVCQPDGHEWNSAQYEAVRKLVHFLGAKYGIRKRNVLGHYQVACSRFGRGRKHDPFKEVDWEKLDLPDNSKLIDHDVLKREVLANLASIRSTCGFSAKAIAGLEASEQMRRA